MAGRRPREAKPPPDAEGTLEIAARYLSARPRSGWEVTRRLRRAGVEEALVRRTLRRLAELGLVDDLAFARWWTEQRDRHAPRGQRLVEAELRQRGVAREVIQTLREERAPPAVGAGAASAVPEASEELAHDALRRHLRGRPIPNEPKARQRLAAFLARRGFDSDTIWTVLTGGADEA